MGDSQENSAEQDYNVDGRPWFWTYVLLGNKKMKRETRERDENGKGPK